MKTKTILSAFLGALLVLAIFCFQDGTWLHVLVYGADSYGNDIISVEVHQYNGSTWILIYNFTSSGASVRINHNQTTKFIVQVKLNSSLASSSEEAKSYTAVYMNISYDSTYVWQNEELNNTSCVLIGGFYYLYEWGNWTSNLPLEGEQYLCTIDYQQYY